MNTSWKMEYGKIFTTSMAAGFKKDPARLFTVPYTGKVSIEAGGVISFTKK